MTIPLITTDFCALAIPGRVHIPAQDGGHLIIKPNRHVIDSSELDGEEASHLLPLQNLGRLILARAFNSMAHGGIGMFNIQENGNWSAHRPREQQHCHIHIYGRARDAETQPFGRALNFTRFEEEAEFNGYTYSDEQIEALRSASENVLSAEDWAKKHCALQVDIAT